MATERQPEFPATAQGADLRDALCRISETYGRGICREPQRVEAMLRDLCPDRRRESFLLVSALRERVVWDIMAGLDTVPDDLLIARSVRNLRDNLGLAEDSARWAVESWLPACRILSTAPDRPLRFESAELPGDEMPESENPRVPVDWVWLGLCAGAGLSAVVALGTCIRVALFHYWNSFGGWLVETAVLSAGLAAAGFGLALVARYLAARSVPNQSALDPNRAAGAMLLEVLTLLALPLVPVVSVGLWAAEWMGELHIFGQAHDLSFHLGRMLQSLILGLFLYRWLPIMTAVQGKIASTMVRRR